MKGIVALEQEVFGEDVGKCLKCKKAVCMEDFRSKDAVFLFFKKGTCQACQDKKIRIKKAVAK
jgi:peroxiredoxin